MSITVSRRGASPPKRRAGSLQGFILPPVVEIRTNLVPTASLCKVPTLQPLQDNLQLLFGGSIDTRSPAHLTFVERGPEHTEFACPVLERCTRFFHCSKTCVPPCALPGPAPVRPKTWEESGLRGLSAGHRGSSSSGAQGISGMDWRRVRRQGVRCR